METREVKSGWVCKYFDEKGFGFIALPVNNNLETNVFFHISDVEGESIRQDDNVSFSLVQSDKGLKAIDIKVVDTDANR